MNYGGSAQATHRHYTYSQSTTWDHGGSPVLFACLIGHTYMSYAPGHIEVDQGQALMGNAWGRTPWPLTFLVENSHRCVFLCSVQSILQYCVWFSMFVQLLSVHIPCDACLLCVYICLVCLYNTQLHTHTYTHTWHTHVSAHVSAWFLNIFSNTM